MLRAKDQILVIFGASGDLTKRKLMPALFELFRSGALPEKFAILGVSRTAFSDSTFRDFQREKLLEFAKNPTEAELDAFLTMLYYASFDTKNTDEYGTLKEKIFSLQTQLGLGDRIVFDIASPPELFETVVDGLSKFGMNKSVGEDSFRRIIVEKPFGSDLKSAVKLNTILSKNFEEQQIYRIDHYLGKETVQNILVLRFSNGIFEPLWNRNYIEFVEISVYETLGVENRASYYEKSGALRDMIQNHLMNLLAFTTLETPSNFSPEAIRDEISKVMRSLRPLNAEDVKQNVIRAQYAENPEKSVKGYLQEDGVNPNSTTETFAMLKLFIDNWRWAGVPFFLSTGKRMPEKKSEIVIHFKSTPQQFFEGQCMGKSCNKLTIRIQPDEGISLMFGLKEPGTSFKVRQVAMDFKYESLNKVRLPEAYERLLLDAMLGDPTLYSKSDAQLASWKIIDPILKYWKSAPRQDLLTYKANSMVPFEAQNLIAIAEGGNVCQITPAEDFESFS